MKNLSYKSCFFAFSLLLLLNFMACKSGPFNLIKPTSPHEAYEKKLISTGLHQTAMGLNWINNAQVSLQKALTINLPYQEKGYFAVEKVETATFRFNLKRGELLQINLTAKPERSFKIYLDVWKQTENGAVKLLASADTLGNVLQQEIEETGIYILRLQPELLVGGAYTLEINTGPSLGYPLKSSNKNQVQSLFGVGRDENTRKHEGVDIFAPFRTAVIAVSAGVVTGVNVNNLGGKVVWFRPAGKNYTLYYAHLDEQTVTEGQTVMQGDTLGRMGNTGNAKTTLPHLHFGIYTNNGAVDPLPFINPFVRAPAPISSSIVMLNTTMRTIGNATFDKVVLRNGTPLRITAATKSDYRVELPDGKIGYLPSKSLTTITKPLSKYKIKIVQPVFDQPTNDGAVKQNLQPGETVDILGIFGDFQLMLDENKQTGWIKK